MTTHAPQEQLESHWLDRLLAGSVRINLEVGLYIILLIAALFTRFYDLESRVMSHDESLHTQFSWYLSEGRGFSHDPLMHGPLQMHLVALSYFLFGDSDATARFPAAAAGVLAVGLVILFRRYLGRWGALTAALLMLISPYMLYYSRYVRNEALVVPLALLMFYAVFRYYETRQPRWLYLLAASLALHATAKETSFIYTAQLLIFLIIFFAWRILRMPWSQARHKAIFLLGLGAAAVGGVLAMGALFQGWAASGSQATPLQGTAGAGVNLAEGVRLSPLVSLGLLLAFLGTLLLLVGLVFEFGRRLRTEFPSLDLIVVVWTVTMPQLAALPANLLGWDPLDYKSLLPVSRTIMLVAGLLLLSVAIGAAWNWRKWLVAAGVFFGLYFVFYTTVFTNSDGIASGLVGSLGYWLEQHGVERGGQPWYYYLFIQIPVYEFLPAIGSLLAMFYVLRGKGRPDAEAGQPGLAFPTVGFLGYWTTTSVTAYSFAGEKMPWLTVHMALPMILFGGWGLAKFLGRVDWRRFTRANGWILLVVLVLFLLSGLHALGSLLGDRPPFMGRELEQLRATNAFLSSLIFCLGTGVALWRLGQGIRFSTFVRAGAGVVLAALFVLTARASFRASFVNYDLATEYLVYAHSAPGVKTAMRQIEDLSRRMTDGLAIQVAYDDDVSWPLNWYLRDYTNQFYFGPNPTRDLLQYPVILVGDNNWHLAEPLLGDRYYTYEYIRMWWPNQDYWSLKWSAIEGERANDLAMQGGTVEPMSWREYLQRVWQHIRPFFTDRAVRQAVWQIWLNRDFTDYGRIVGRDMAIRNWSPSDRMRLYVRKDVAAQVWDYGLSPIAIEPPTFEDPYREGMLDLFASQIVGGEGQDVGQFFRPRDVAISPDGSLYVADTSNHRIQRVLPTGEGIGQITAWGSFADIHSGEAPGGTFNEPWGLAVGTDGTVYVADTWNHRIQWFAPDGGFLGMFGEEGTGDAPLTFWGPRDVAVDSQGRVFVADTGNKLVKVFDRQGRFLTEFGGAGYLPGYLDEPVGLAVDAQDQIYVADTWNQRIQVFAETGEGVFEPVRDWSLEAWFGQSLENKPYLDVDKAGNVCATDPEGFRVLCFDGQGEFMGGWGSGFGREANQFNLLSGVAIDPSGSVWVVDSGNSRLMRFEPPFLHGSEE